MENKTTWKVIVGAVALVAILPVLGLGYMALMTLAIATWGCEKLDDIPFIDCEVAFGDHQTRGCNGPVSEDLSENIPPEWGELFSKAAQELEVNPNALAALFLSENSNEWRPLDYPWDTASGDDDPGGPMQFKPSTFRGFEVEGHGDLMEPEDAMFAAASLIKSEEYGPTNPSTSVGNVERPWKRDTLLYTVGAYNWGSGNAASKTTADTGLEDVAPVETQNYQTNVHELMTSNFTVGADALGDPVVVGKDGNPVEAPGVSGDVVQASDTAGGAAIPAAGDDNEDSGGSGPVSWPVRKDAPIPDNGRFGDRDGGHHGVDFSLPLGEDIYAAADGEVVFAEAFDPDGYGSMIKLEHTIDGAMVETWYAHMPDANEEIEAGDTVEAGQRIASIGEAGNSTGPHLHFEVHPGGGDAIDPLAWLESNGATTVSPGDCGGSGDISGVDPPAKDENGNWPPESCSVAPDPTNGTGCVTPRTATVAEMVTAWGVPEGMTSCFSQRTWGEHPLGRACDITMGSLGTRASGADKEMGDRLSRFLQANTETWAIEYVIWYGEIWSASRASEGWRPYSISSCDPTTTTCGHFDHIHVTVY